MASQEEERGGIARVVERVEALAELFDTTPDLFIGAGRDMRSLLTHLATVEASNRNLMTMLEEEAYHRMNAGSALATVEAEREALREELEQVRRHSAGEMS